jgi:hypothetical protein
VSESRWFSNECTVQRFAGSTEGRGRIFVGGGGGSCVGVVSGCRSQGGEEREVGSLVQRLLPVDDGM